MQLLLQFAGRTTYGRPQNTEIKDNKFKIILLLAPRPASILYNPRLEPPIKCTSCGGIDATVRHDAADDDFLHLSAV